MDHTRSTCHSCARAQESFWDDAHSGHGHLRSRRPTARARRSASVPSRALTGGLVGVLCAVLMPATSVHAATLPAEPSEDLDSLMEEAQELGDEYSGELMDMSAIMDDAERATERAEATQEDVAEAQEQVRQLAITSYQEDGLDPALTIFVEESPEEIIDRAVLVEHLSNSQQSQIEDLEQAIERDRTAQENAEERLEEFEDDLVELEERRSEVHELIADYPDQEQQGPYNLTPRTELMRQTVIEEFGEGPGVGCYRPHDGGPIYGEHPLGRACDFMMTNDGVMPPQDEIDRGWAISEWARENAEEYGVMYVIYRQQIWDVRRGDTDWRPMSDRGSITDNHFDHVHISMF
ncbi:hypothetical protein RIF23_19690 [Lipingzhangella sp. LS1_29]|uniref:ARB-07466-like C-terminal domain-containing protein n=1 Tax=Lipingzhangella rawalii TaxID=2055835 RepID=A0ABU2HB12_9ACTN|nr:hypothetical protein [Lipingzhangella rawalii]MDS1272515.1 hypothetical protein [Lipingzhangella rawalii]